MKSVKEMILKGIAKTAEHSVKEACGSKSGGLFFEAEMPKALKDKKFNK